MKIFGYAQLPSVRMELIFLAPVDINYNHINAFMLRIKN
jgi:hypothetical protein